MLKLVLLELLKPEVTLTVNYADFAMGVLPVLNPQLPWLDSSDGEQQRRFGKAATAVRMFTII